MSAFPNNINTVNLSSGSSVQPGIGFGGDNGVGFHSTQPVRLERHDDTENVHNRDKLKQSDGDLVADGQLANYPKYPQSPYVRYVSRPLSHGNLSTGIQTHTPEDRSKMGQPLNPFWIRNDLWSMENEADIFMDVGPNWVAPRLAAHTKQSAQIDRETYLDNEEQIQHSSETSRMGRESESASAAAPVAPIAGQVTSAVSAGAMTAGDLKMEDANPAKVRKEDAGSEPKETDIDAKRKRSDEASKGEEGTDKVTAASSSTATAPPTKKGRKGKGKIA